MCLVPGGLIPNRLRVTLAFPQSVGILDHASRIRATTRCRGTSRWVADPAPVGDRDTRHALIETIHRSIHKPTRLPETGVGQDADTAAQDGSKRSRLRP